MHIPFLACLCIKHLILRTIFTETDCRNGLPREGGVPRHIGAAGASGLRPGTAETRSMLLSVEKSVDLTRHSTRRSTRWVTRWAWRRAFGAPDSNRTS